MKRPTKIAHPLKGRKGTSQKARASKALQAEYAPVDGKTLADRLYMISEYARQIKYHELATDSSGKEYIQTDTWTAFFTESLAFQLAILSKTSGDTIEEQFHLLYTELKENPSTQALDMVLGFVYDKTIQPYHSLYQAIVTAENSFQTTLLGVLENAFKESLIKFIALYNASANYLCVSKRSFLHFQEAPWNFSIAEIFAIDTCIKKVTKGKKKAILMAGAKAEALFLKLIQGVADIVALSPDYIEESLIPLEESLQQKHEPHLALLFTFLKLYEHLKGDINELGKEHLDFFYQQVLKIKPKDAVPDNAHVLFEIANHLEAYPLKKDLPLKDGKDDQGEDIQFNLDHDLVIDKAQIKDLRTLFVNKITDGEDDYVEGIYLAPVANSLDGKGKKFKENQPKNWSTLGSKESKFFQEGALQVDEHPRGRIGFVLSSPVLFLQEGQREITIILDCDVSTVHEDLNAAEIAALLNDISAKLNISNSKTTYCINDQLLATCELSMSAKAYLSKLLITSNPYEIDANSYDEFVKVKDPISCKSIFSPTDKEKLKGCLEGSDFTKKDESQALFNAWFSGEKDWIKSVPTVTINDPPIAGETPSGEIQFVLKFTLTAEDPAVVFYNEENLKEPLDLQDQFPLIKVELNPDIRVDCGSISKEREKCCLSKRFDDVDLLVSPYQLLKNLQLVNAQIDVEVCGVKNLIVQNDENLQDVNNPILPFGPRPKVGDAGFIDGGANFYIGSKEIFCKDWQKFWINMEWKDKPANMADHYEFYASGVPFEDGTNSITDASFKYRVSILQEGIWKSDTHSDPPPDPPDYKLFQLFANNNLSGNDCGNINNEATFSHGVEGPFTQSLIYEPKSMSNGSLEPLTVNSRKGFARITLAGVSFQHARYAYVLAKQMMALADLISPEDLENLIELADQALTLSNVSGPRIDALKAWSDTLADLKDQISKAPPPPFDPFNFPTNIPDNRLPGGFAPYGLEKIDDAINKRIDSIKNLLTPKTDGIPNEPYTPQLKSLSVDYKATAVLNDMEIVHLYPFENTSKGEDIEQDPLLMPYLNDEGTLFLGIENLTPGNNLSLLFQLAEATADSEASRANVKWYYLSNNEWIELRPEFEVLSDETDGLTVSGIVNIAIPDTISNISNTVMPEGLYWIKVSAADNVEAVAETLGIHTQAGRATANLSEGNDTGRLAKPLEAKKISKLVKGDFNVKKIEQPYPSVGGRLPEGDGHYYIRVSEHLKHKGRAQLLEDYEKIVLEGFPEIFKTKCISHTIGLSGNFYRRDLEIAPGFIIVAVIPDLNLLQSGNSLEPKAPVSLLEKISKHLKATHSPFARLKVMNPRYEPIKVCIEIRFKKGTPEKFYSKQLKEDITHFLAPWYLGDTDKLAFGQEIYYSDLVGFVEGLDYVDYIVDLELLGPCEQKGLVIYPLTARSILTAGEVCVEVNREECPDEAERTIILNG